MTSSFVLRPSALSSPDEPAFQPPSSDQLLGQWFVVHTSLPFWRNKRNIQITYSAPPSPALATDLVIDTVTYQVENSAKLKTVQGTNTPAQSEHHGAWDWRGTGFIKVVSNHWEVLGHGDLGAGEKECWIVIHTQKSFFTPAAIHVYSRSREPLSEDVLKPLMAALAQHLNLRDLIGNMYQIQHN